MGHAIFNRPIGLLNETLIMSFFQENFHFDNSSWFLDQWRPKKRTSLKEDSNWLDILKPRCMYRVSQNTTTFNTTNSGTKGRYFLGHPVGTKVAKCWYYKYIPYIHTDIPTNIPLGMEFIYIYFLPIVGF